MHKTPAVAAVLEKHAVEAFAPLHMPSSTRAPALKLWKWSDGLKRLQELAGDAEVQVQICRHVSRFACTDELCTIVADARAL